MSVFREMLDALITAATLLDHMCVAAIVDINFSAMGTPAMVYPLISGHSYNIPLINTCSGHDSVIAKFIVIKCIVQCCKVLVFNSQLYYQMMFSVLTMW